MACDGLDAKISVASDGLDPTLLWGLFIVVSHLPNIVSFRIDSSV